MELIIEITAWEPAWKGFSLGRGLGCCWCQWLWAVLVRVGALPHCLPQDKLVLPAATLGWEMKHFGKHNWNLWTLTLGIQRGNALHKGPGGLSPHPPPRNCYSRIENH